MYFLIFRWLQTGGVETLTLREGEWLKKNKGDVCIITQIISDDMRRLYKKLGVDVVVLNKWNAKEIHNAVILKKQVIDLMQMYDLGDFLKYKCHYPNHNVKIIYYCVHPISDCFFKSSRIGKKLFIHFFSDAISKFNKNKNILYMDEETLTANLDNYNLEHERGYFSTCPLPFKIHEQNMHERSKDVFRILTVSRVDFPYKGYLLGLIDVLNNNFEELSEFELTIITHGNYQVLIDKINSMNEKLKERIVFIDHVTPDKLPEYYQSADLYVGMGTTVLEASDYGVTSVVAQYDTYEFVSTGLFKDNPLDLGSKVSEGISGIEYIKNVAGLTDSDYERIQNDTKKALKDNYDEDIILEKIDGWQCYDIERLSVISNLFFKLYFQLKDWKFR